MSGFQVPTVGSINVNRGRPSTPVVWRGAVDKEWAARQKLTQQAREALTEVEKQREVHPVLFWALALKSRGAVRDIAVAFAADAHGVTPDDIRGRRRFKKIIDARRDAIGMASIARPDLGLCDIARLFNLDHATVFHHQKALGIHRPAHFYDKASVEGRKSTRAEVRERVRARQEAGYSGRGPQSRLTPAIVTEMRLQHRLGVTPAEIARRFAVNPKTARCIVRRTSWKHLP